MTRLLIRPEAQVELEEAALWYEDQRPGLGEVSSGKVFDLIDQVGESPLQFPVVVPPVRRALLHRYPYAVYFVLGEQAIVIIAVLHHRRDPAVWKRRV